LQAAGDFDDPLGDLEALEDLELAEVRGSGIRLPNGMTIEVTVIRRLLVDDQELVLPGVADGREIVQPVFGSATQNLDISQQGSILNSLDGISLRQYREINFFISNLPPNVLSSRFLPDPDVSSHLTP
jgi:hypothetical protein